LLDFSDRPRPHLMRLPLCKYDVRVEVAARFDK
jgi:hypothetical protein